MQSQTAGQLTALSLHDGWRRLGPMRILVAQICLAVCLSTGAAAAPLPEFPMLQELHYPQDEAGIRARMGAGEGYATLRVALQTQCGADDEACWARIAQLYALAESRGQSAAPAFLRLRLIEANRARAEDYAIGDSVCGRHREELPEIVRRIASINYPVRGLRAWTIEERRGSLGSERVIVTKGAVSAHLTFSGERLMSARVFTNFLEAGSSRREIRAVQRANAEIAHAICPQWAELDDAIPDYMMGVALSWPPQAVHADGPSVWLAATGVMPDIFWFDLYVDPTYQFYISVAGAETFEATSGLGLAP